VLLTRTISSRSPTGNCQIRKCRHLLHHTSGETRSLNVHSEAQDQTTGSETEQVSSREIADRYDHLVFLAKLDKISHIGKDPRTLLEKLCPKVVDRLEGCDLRRLLDYRWRHRLSDEVLFRYYEGARAPSDFDFKLRILTPKMFMTRSADLDTHKAPQQRVLETLQRTSEQATKTTLSHVTTSWHCTVRSRTSRRDWKFAESPPQASRSQPWLSENGLSEREIPS